MTVVILFVFGSIVGSFLNVVGLRWGSLRGLGGRSSCPSCGKVLEWRELVPIVSFLTLKARCRGCRAKISWQYPIIEIWTGLIFATVPYIFIPVFCIYIIIVIYDIHHKIIPDPLVYSAIFLSFLIPLYSLCASQTYTGLCKSDLHTYSTLDWLAGPILFVFFGLIWLLSRGRAMGLGDAKLGLSVGLLLGAISGFSAVVLAFWIGAFGSLAYLFLNKVGFLKNAKKLTMKSEVPFAPFIVAGAWMSLVFHLNILHVALF